MTHAAEDGASGPDEALRVWGVAPRRRARIGAVGGDLDNAAWHVWTPAGRHLVVRRSTVLRSLAEVAYEMAVLRHLGALGWAVPVPAAEPVAVGGHVYSLCSYVPGGPCDDGPETGRRRGVLLARLHAALLPLRDRLGQRPGWRPQPVIDDPRFEPARRQGLERLRADDPALAAEIEGAHAAALAELAGLGLDALPAFLLHGDFTTGNVRQRRGRPRGAVDFDLCHVGNRPWELVIARLQRAPALLEGYRAEAAALGVPLTAAEERALPAVYRVFRAGMVGWALVAGAHRGGADAAFIRVQLGKLRLGVGRR